ncbi:MAG TPA: mechanosensitive ion channel family protein [Tissierellaceae bacterium]|nr:mechanosensitive ion channel family protein [Tissierellaceae bacterium]
MENINYLVETYLKDNIGNLNILGRLIKIILIFVVIWLVNRIANKVIDKTLSTRKTKSTTIDDKRANTLALVLKKLVYYILTFIGIMMVLDMFNVPTTSILATAGIGGLAIGFGAQSLVKDIITGFFILLEDQYSVGDLIETGDFEGVVEELGLRVTKLRAFSGELHIIPNSSIQTVTNKTRGAMRALVQVTIAYEENIDRAMEVLNKACERLKKENKAIVEGPVALGVAELAEYGFVINIIARTKPMEQWAVERAIRKMVKETLDKEGIEIPYPKRIIIGGEKE